MDPRIETIQLRLVGVQGIVHLDGDVSDQLGSLYGRLFGRLRQIPDISRPHRSVGYWQFVESQVRVYFAGIEVDSFRHFRWDYERGLVAWNSGPTTFAIWKERNGQEGKLRESGLCWEWLARSPYLYNTRFLGDFEVYYWKTVARDPQSEYHEVWIPVAEKGVSPSPHGPARL